MKKNFILLMVILLLSCSCGSSSQSLDPQGYHAGTDMQFFELSNRYMRAKIQETDTGCFFFHDGFIYRFDREKGTILPLCSKANCLHDAETDKEKRKECHACVDSLLDPDTLTLMLYENNLYAGYVTETLPVRFVKIACDGSSKDVIYEESGIEVPILHRGYIYYLSHKYKVEDGAIAAANGYGLFRINVEEKNPKPEQLYVPPTGISSFTAIKAYGKYVYFGNYAYDKEKATGVLGLYNIETGKTEKSNAQGMYTFLTGKLYTKGGVLEKLSDRYYEVPLSCSTLEGNETKEVLNIPQGVFLTSDTHYLYINSGSLNAVNPEEKKFFKVYDSSMNLVDEFIVPEEFGDQRDFPVGGERYLYMRYEDEDTGEWGIMYWDKSSIGTLHGKAPEIVKVVY